MLLFSVSLARSLDFHLTFDNNRNRTLLQYPSQLALLQLQMQLWTNRIVVSLSPRRT